jgi:NADPH:quinone reductase-like Zn-dependent oxidoreductase
MNTPREGLQLRSKIRNNNTLELALVNQLLTAPKEDEVLIQVQATPINPSDIGLLFGAADMRTAQTAGTGRFPMVVAQVPAAAMPGMTGRLNLSMPVGNEGAGLVIEAGSSSATQALLGKTVAVMGGGMYAQYRTVKALDCLVLPEGTTAAQGASCFINPLTALGFVETMKREGHSALIHTAAASNLGQMLNRVCQQDRIDLINIVRKPEQAELLRALGARYVVNSAASTFADDLAQACFETGATLAFDATGGGPLAGQILEGMEAALGRHATQYSRYGTSVHKQVYLYGNLDLRPTEIKRNIGMAWGVGGWLVFPYLQKLGPDANIALRQRVAQGLHTTFASHYAKEISLAEALSLEAIAHYGKRETGQKYLINPSRW